LTGCSSQTEKDVVNNDKFTITKKQSDIYSDSIKTCLDNNYWKCDKNDILYSEKTLLAGEEFTGIAAASKLLDMNLENYKNQTIVEAQTKLLHYNNELAGTVHFYFKGNDMIGAYYNNTFDEASVFSLKDRNIFTSKVSFNAYEDASVKASFNPPRNAREMKNGFCAIGTDSNNNSVFASIDGDSVKFYHYKNNAFYLSNSLNFSDTGLVPSDVLLFKENNTLQCAILLDSVIAASEDSETTMKSKKVVFYNQSMLKSYDEILLEDEDYLALGYDDSSIILFEGSNMEYYKLLGNAWSEYNQISLGHEVQSFVKDDIDGDNVYEYIMMDGKDMFVYHKENTLLKNIWKTHVSVENLTGDLFVSDLNSDGVKEIYVLDSTGTTIRYVLGTKGFISQNEDIMYGDQIYPADFNGDGKQDYIKLNTQDKNMQQLYIRN
jgi:hypothetical protein